ncbi:M3 family metallopeptidase [Wenzhouxiangella sp. XN79A]|uniref:M3 family metallopeptidase n=1 Tax=Wenzhouxiangella sp. XN79A TaxID=2724193 RepID=UPI00144A6527|nr:M3 family metallopeptidase [Wenzhouxiangella sp. XN79A]NKI34913.1 M3 family metallopeptidase [Wenzhouxiangella sp. XN79A]
MTETNPLLEPGLPRFDAVRPEHALPAVERRLAEYQALLDAIERGERDATPETLADEVRADDALALAWSTVGHLHAVTNTPEWREAFTACLEKITAFYTARGQNRALYGCWNTVASSDDFNDRPEAFRRMVAEELIDFRQSGVDLDDDARERFTEISLRLSTLGNTFGNHVLDATEGYTEHFETTDALAGLPDSALHTLAARAEAADRDGWLADLSYPCYHAIVTYADDRKLRERFYTAHATRASSQGPQAGQHDNEPIVDEMLALRREQAALLGYPDPAAAKLERRMAPNAETVENFLRGLAKRARATAAEQLEELTAFAVEQGGPDRLEPWDIAYYSEKMREATLGLNQEKLKPYFELERTLTGLFGLAERLFGIRFERDDDVPTWHADVRYYRVRLGQDGDRAQPDAGLYLDLYARSGKQGGAWMDVCRQRSALSGTPRAPVAFLTCNFAAPRSGHPSLLRHDDVVTLFHEFGHCLHHLLTRVDWPPVAGISGVEWDAVELPSQLLEGWTWEPAFLNTFARHHETGEALPAAWVEALNDDRKFLGAIALTRQLEFALTDMALHRDTDEAPVEVMRRIHDEVAVTPLPEFNRYLMSFSHLFDGGYAAGYYSYLWAEQLARDAFELFRERGLLDVEVGRRLREEILAVGGSRPMAESWQAFRGRAAMLEPLLDAYGIAA